MALEDRDWYRENPSDAWRKMYPGRQASQRPERSPATRTRKRRGRVAGWIVTALAAVALGVGYGAWQDKRLPWQTRHSDSGPTRPLANHVKARSTPKPQPTQVAGSSKVVRLRSRPGLDIPAKRVTRWWVTDQRFGKVSVYVPVGTTPREALTRALAAKGYQVLP